MAVTCVTYVTQVGFLNSPADDNVGVKYGAYRIEESAMDVVTGAAVEKSHTRLIDTIAVYNKTKALADEFNETEKVEKQMKALAGKLVKSKDILYPCKFCRHLWT